MHTHSVSSCTLCNLTRIDESTPYRQPMEVAGIVAAVLLAVVGLFQVALAVGAPWGAAAWGGRHPGVLPRRQRITSALVGVVVYPLIAVVVLRAAGVAGTAPCCGSASTVVMWLLTGFFALGAVLNLASRSPVERIWAPVSAGIAICCGVIAAGM